MMAGTNAQHDRRISISVGFLSVIGMLVFGCGPASSEEASVQPENQAPQPIELSAQSKDFLFRYLSADGTSVKTAQSIAEIPEACRQEVVVVPTSPDKAPPPGWDFVADLRQALPQTVPARRGFNLETRSLTRVAQPNAPPTNEATLEASAKVAATPPLKESSSKKVFMFSSPGCPYCDKARSFFERKRVSFSEYDLEREGRRARQKLATLAQAAGVNPQSLSGVPIIFVGKHVIRGFDRRRLSQLLGI